MTDDEKKQQREDEREERRREAQEENELYDRMTKDDVKHYKLTFVFLSGTKVTRTVLEDDMKRVFSLTSDSYIFETPNVDPLAFNRDQLEYIDCQEYWPGRERYFTLMTARSQSRFYERQRTLREEVRQNEQRQPKKRTWF